MTHKTRFGGEFTINGIDDTFTTYCGLNEWNTTSDDLFENRLVGRHDECTCKKCNKSYEKEMDLLKIHGLTLNPINHKR